MKDQLEQKDWFEYKQFKDPVYGYIPVNRVYVSSLIDTHMMQRIKGVAQTGLRPVFSSATHDRFSHSLGVYKFGMAMYDSLASKLTDYTNSTCFTKWGLNKEEKKEVANRLDKYMKHWRTLLAIGCLLHDIGHPVQSHGFEFLYDDPYLDVDYEKNDLPVVIGDSMDEDERKRVFNLFKGIDQSEEKSPEGNLRKELLKTFQQKDTENRYDAPVPGSPHERMSAYYILQDKDLGEKIIALIKKSREMICKKDEDSDEEELDKKKINQDICFIARMIIGWEYPVEKQLSFNKDMFFNSVRNCVIHILNGEIDADGIDYLMRNSYAAGYDTSKVDSTRLCNAYTVYEKNYLMFPAFSKSALSVLEGYMSARNFEPKWLYSHHKVVYADLLTKRIFKYITRYLTDQTMLLQSVKFFMKHASKSALVFDGEQNFESDLLLMPKKGKHGDRVHLNAKTLRSHMEQWSYPFHTYLLAPCRKYAIDGHRFSKSSDADMETLFHWMFNELEQYKVASNVQDGTNEYSEYAKHLKEQVLNSAQKEPAFISKTKELRILIAETCLDKMSRGDEQTQKILKEWAETGNINNAVLDTINEGEIVTDMLSRIGDGSNQELLKYWLEEYSLLLSPLDFAEFINLLNEYHTRCYRSSLWKSLPEYQLFMKDCAVKTGFSLDDVYRYMLVLIEEGMNVHGFSIFDGKAVYDPPELFKEQFFYQQHEREKNDRRNRAAEFAQARVISTMPVRPNNGKKVAQDSAKAIFTKTDNYDFSQIKLVVKLYRLKPKRFNKINLLFNETPVPLNEVLPQTNSIGNLFPYFYYQRDDINRDSGAILKAFQKRFIEFCIKYRERVIRSETIQVRNKHVFRDSIYGDIEMPDKFYAVVRTREFQRLGRIRQLATGDRSFPNATHTRLAHSIGTWHVMRLILERFKTQYKSNPQLEFSDEEEDCALLAALLHDLGHGPYSHAIEAVFDGRLNHEEITRRIIMDTDTELRSVIEKEFGQEIPNRVCELLDGTFSVSNDKGISLIYRTLISSQLDADRIDYLLRDNISCGMSFGHIDIQQLIASMRMLPVYNDVETGSVYRLCFDEQYLPAIEQFIYARHQMYRNVYHDPQKLLFEQLLKRILHKAFSLVDKIETEHDLIYPILKKIYEKKDITVSEILLLDDESLNGLIKKWSLGEVLTKDANVEKNTNPSILASEQMIIKLSQAFLNRSPMFEQIELGRQQRQYFRLAENIGKKIERDCSTFSELEDVFCSIVFIQGEDNAYKKYVDYKDRKKNIILRNLDDGTTSDYFDRSMFLSANGSTTNTLLTSDYCYLFFSEDLLKDDCLILGKTDELARTIMQLIESAKPRKHIEIEKKYYCTKEVLTRAKDYFDKNYVKDQRESGTMTQQIDTYYDYKVNDEWLLLKNHYSFRCREKNGKCVFTVKIPTNSPNYSSPSQFARHEHEFETSTPLITDEVYKFFIDTLDIYGGSYNRDIINFISDSTSKDKMQAQLIVENQRISYKIKEMCEVCLDTVDYKTFKQTAIGEQDYQIEIELLDDPENWYKMECDIIEPFVNTIGKEKLMPTNKSKLEKGLEYLKKSNS